MDGGSAGRGLPLCRSYPAGVRNINVPADKELALSPSRALWDVRTMRPEEARVGTKVKVCEHHRISERRGMVGRIVGRYGGESM